MFQVIARTADGTVYAAHDANTLAPVLIAVSATDGPASVERLARRISELPADAVLERHLEPDRSWAVLPPGSEQVAVRLVGLTEPPQQNWLAAGWGWPHPYPRTIRQLGFRIACTLIAGVIIGRLLMALIG
jgi:hypothetical protein